MKLRPGGVLLSVSPAHSRARCRDFKEFPSEFGNPVGEKTPGELSAVLLCQLLRHCEVSMDTLAPFQAFFGVGNPAG